MFFIDLLFLSVYGVLVLVFGYWVKVPQQQWGECWVFMTFRSFLYIFSHFGFCTFGVFFVRAAGRMPPADWLLINDGSQCVLKMATASFDPS